MLQLIKNALEKENVAVWQIKKTQTQRAELYFIKKKLDIPRFAVIPEYRVVVYRDFEENGQKFRGVSSCFVEEGQTQEEINEKIKNAYFGAQFVKNPFYELAKPVVADKKPSKSNLAGKSIQEVANAFADAVLEIPTDDTAFVNSLEIFVYRKTVELLSSNGLHVSYDSDKVDGEFVTQCTKPVDVEQHRQFAYDNFDIDALKEKIASAIEDVRKRANAKEMPETGTYNVVLTGEAVKTVLSYYLTRGNAAVIFPGYSTWKVGDSVQKAGSGEKLNIDLIATTPYSDDGVEMKDTKLVENGLLQNIFGATRFMRYMNEEPNGSFEKFSLKNGTVKFEDMIKEGTLQPVCFSDFQMDFFSGNFGGEMRLALLRKDGKNIPLTGGSINGKITDVDDKLIFSVERYEDSEYSGPYALMIPNVSVAGK